MSAPPVSPLATVPSGSIAAAAVVSGVFFLLAIPVAYSFRVTLFKTYILLLASALLRGAAFALHGAAIAHRDPNCEAAFHALRQAGFGMAIGVLGLIYVSWFKNCSPWARPFGSRVEAAASLMARATIPVVIIAGPILGAVSAGLLYSGSPHTMAPAVGVRTVSIWALFAAMAAIGALGLFAAGSCLLGARRARRGAAALEGGAADAPGSFCKDIHALVLLPLAANAVLAVAMAQRIAWIYEPRFLSEERLYYDMSALPEILNVLLLVAPTLLARIAMCGRASLLLRCTGGARRRPRVSPRRSGSASIARPEARRRPLALPIVCSAVPIAAAAGAF